MLYRKYATSQISSQGRWWPTSQVKSYLTYLIPLYGGCPDYLLNALQTLQNRAAGLLTKSSWFTASSSMLLQVGWLSVRQLIVFHSLVLVFKAKQEKRPVYLHGQVSATFNVNTRLALNNGIRETRRVRSNIGKQSFIPRTIIQWNSLPHNIRSIPILGQFKTRLRLWVKQNYWKSRPFFYYD